MTIKGDKAQCRKALEHFIGKIVTKGVKKVAILLIDNGGRLYRLDDLRGANMRLQLALNAFFILAALFTIAVLLITLRELPPYLIAIALLSPMSLPILHIHILQFVLKPLNASSARVFKFVLEYDDDSRLFKALEILERLNGVKSICAIREFLLAICSNDEFKPRSYYEEIIDLGLLRQRLGIKWGIYLVRGDSYEAFGICLPWSMRILISSKLLAALEESELSAVLTHEACHIINCDPLRALAVIAIFQLINSMLISTGLVDLTPLLMLMLLEAFIVTRLMRLWEFKADEYATRVVSSSPLIKALVKTCWRELIDEIMGGLAFRAKLLLSTHPPVYERIRRAYTYNHACVMSNSA